MGSLAEQASLPDAGWARSGVELPEKPQEEFLPGTGFDPPRTFEKGFPAASPKEGAPSPWGGVGILLGLLSAPDSREERSPS